MAGPRAMIFKQHWFLEDISSTSIVTSSLGNLGRTTSPSLRALTATISSVHVDFKAPTSQPSGIGEFPPTHAHARRLKYNGARIMITRDA